VSEPEVPLSPCTIPTFHVRLVYSSFTIARLRYDFLFAPVALSLDLLPSRRSLDRLDSAISPRTTSVETDWDDREGRRDWEGSGGLGGLRGIGRLGMWRIRARGEWALGAGRDEHLLALDFSLALSHR